MPYLFSIVRVSEPRTGADSDADDLVIGSDEDTRFPAGPGADRDIVTDFSTSDGDRIVTSLAYRIAAHAAGNALLDFNGGATLTLQGITAASVQVGRFAAA